MKMHSHLIILPSILHLWMGPSLPCHDNFIQTYVCFSLYASADSRCGQKKCKKMNSFHSLCRRGESSTLPQILLCVCVYTNTCVCVITQLLTMHDVNISRKDFSPNTLLSMDIQGWYYKKINKRNVANQNTVQLKCLLANNIWCSAIRV